MRVEFHGTPGSPTLIIGDRKMDPDLQAALSCKYTAQLLALIPIGDRIFIFNRAHEHIDTIPSAELVRWLSADLTRQRSQRESALAAEIRPPIVDIDFIL